MSRVIDYDLEMDELDDVLNENNIQGLSHASIERGKVMLYVLSDDWTDSSLELVHEVCRDFGYWNKEDIIVEGSND